MWFYISFALINLAIRPAVGSRVDYYEDPQYYSGMQLLLLTPAAGETVWNRKLGVIVGVFIPDSEVFSLVNRRDWRIHFVIESGNMQITSTNNVADFSQLMDVRTWFDGQELPELLPGPVVMNMTIEQVGMA